MSWLTARARIAEVLKSVSIAQPIVQEMAAVYETEWDTIQDVPCCVIKGEGVEPERSSGLNHRIYTVPIDLLVVDHDNKQQLLIASAFREAILDAFDQDVALNGQATVIGGPACEPPTSAAIAGIGTGVGISMVLTVRIYSAASFGL